MNVTLTIEECFYVISKDALRCQNCETIDNLAIEIQYCEKPRLRFYCNKCFNNSDSKYSESIDEAIEDWNINSGMIEAQIVVDKNSFDSEGEEDNV